MNMDVDKYVELGKVFAEFLERGRHIYDADPRSCSRPTGWLHTSRSS